MRVLLAASIVLAGLWIAACGGSDSTGPVEVGSVTVGPAVSAFTSLGQTAQLNAVVADVNGQTISNPDVTWSSSNTAVATVNASGLVSATGNGSAIITASSGGKSGTADVSVAHVVA